MTKKIFIFICLNLFIYSEILSANIQILVNVDNEIITSHDVKKEIYYLEILNPNLTTLSEDRKLNLAKISLIKETIKKKEVKKFLKTNNNVLSEDYIKNLYLRLGLNSEKELENKLKEKNTYSLNEIKKKIELELAWNELIYLKYNKQVQINMEEIEKKINSIESSINKRYLLSEIVFTKNKAQSLDEQINEIKTSINEIGFDNTANIYSKSLSSKYGGKLDWIDEINISEIIKKELDLRSKGEITNVLQLENNFLILKVEDIEFVNKRIDKTKEIEKLINVKTNEILNKYSEIYYNKIKLNYPINEK